MRMLKNFFKKFNMLLVILINILYTLYEEQISKGKKKYIMNLKKLVDYILLILDLFEVNWFEQLLRELLQIFTYKLETYIIYENINEFCESLEKTTEIIEKLAENSDKSSIDILKRIKVSVDKLKIALENSGSTRPATNEEINHLRSK